jgi:hypothetical protein
MASKKCGRCLLSHPLSDFNKDKYTKSGYRSQCKSCMAQERLDRLDWSKNWRSLPKTKEAYRIYRAARYQKDRLKIKARNATRKLSRLPCEVCGLDNTEGHHPDYAKPLDVIWLCREHHNDWHKENGEGLNAH